MMILALIGLAGPLANQAEPQGKGPDPAARSKIRLAIPAPSFSYLPIYVAIRKGFFARRGFDMEIIQMAAGLAAPALSAQTYDSVRDTFSKAGIPADEQAKSYIAMLGATAGLKGDLSPTVIFDFSFAAEAARN